MKILLASETKPLGQIFRERRLISEEDLKNALALQQERTDKIGRILIDLGYVAERDILAAVSDQLKVPIFDGEYPAVPIEADRLPFRFLRAFNVIPVHLENSVLTLVMADPLDAETQNAIHLRTGFTLQIFLSSEADIQVQLERLYGGEEENSSEKLIETLGDFGADDENIEHLRDLASEAPVIRLVNLIISRAIEARASDIHLEPFEKELRLRYRVDGVLQNMDPPPNALRAAIISRIKLMAKLNIAERRLPQDGRIKLKVLGREIDLRVSTLPTMYGESVVMRILDRSNSSLIDLRRLGFPDDLYDKICQMTSKPHGIFLVTGLVDMGVEDYLLSSSLIGILAQRLVRVSCKECKRPERVPAGLLDEAGFDVTGLGEFVEVQKGSGCKECDDTGYESRIGIFELLDINDAMRHLIVKTADATVLKAEAVRSGMRTLKQDGWSKVLAGLTSPDEVLRVTQEV